MIRQALILTLLVASAVGGPFSNIKPRANTGPRDDPLDRTPPNLPGGVDAVDAVPGPFFQGIQPPFPTDGWWAPYTVSNQDAVAAGPFPFQSKTANEGLEFGISDHRAFDGTSIHVNTQLDWRASYFGLPVEKSNRKALAWDTQTVCLQYFGGGSTMDSCLVPGSPYITLAYENAAVVLTSLKGDINDFQWVNPGTKGKVVTPGGTYLIYVTEGNLNALVANGATLTSPSGFAGTIRIAKLKEASQEAVLDRHVNSIPVSMTMTYNVAGDTSTQTWTWDVSGDAGNLLLLSWPHHREVLQNPQYTDIQYLTLKGHMRGVIGNQWVQRHSLPTISWFAPNNPHPSCLGELAKTLESEVSELKEMIPGDFYFWGGSLARAAQMATIAEHIGRADLIDKVVDVLKMSIGHWFQFGPDHAPRASFEPGWGGFINGDGWNNTWVDFGNAYYNDHHFHYGYIMHAAAVIGKYDMAWLNQNMDFFMQIARDYGNPSPNDPHYTVTRHMDWFAGHSWASGIANGAGGRDQESSGEAINGYYGLLLFGTAINNQVLIDYSRLLLAMEMAGSKAYWHLYPNAGENDTPYPEKAFRDLVTVGNVMDTQAGAWLFWGGQRIQIAAIQILPLTPIGNFYYDVPWMEEVLKYCQAEIDDPKLGDDFKSVILAAYARVNPQRAYEYSSRLFDWGSGNSASNQLYFVATQNSAADICSASLQQPEGTFTIQDVDSDLFVTSKGDGGLAATTGADVLATKFELAFRPGGGTIKALSNNKFVTAAPGDGGVLAASRDVAQSYETFRWTEKAGGLYELTAMVNKKPVSVVPGTGELVNTGATSTFRLVPAEDSEPPAIPATGRLRSLQNNRYVVATAGDPTLRTTAGGGDATSWAFARIPESPDNAPTYSIQSQTTQKYVTGDAGGTIPLAALRDAPQGWEHFQIVPYQGNYIIVHVVSGNAVAVQGDDTLVDNNRSIDNSARWFIE